MVSFPIYIILTFINHTQKLPQTSIFKKHSISSFLNWNTIASMKIKFQGHEMQASKKKPHKSLKLHYNFYLINLIITALLLLLNRNHIQGLFAYSLDFI